MGDMADEYRVWDKHKKEKKASNKESSTKLLIDNEIDFESKNDGVHLVVITWDGETVDFWPSTGKWIVRGGKTSRGVKNLIRYCKDMT